MKTHNKGLVLEVNKNKVIVLTSSGEFLEKSYSGQAPQIGSEIEITSGWSINRQVIAMLSIAAILALIIIPILSIQNMLIPQTAVAYVTVDINPSIELGLNKADKVISTKGLNKEGEYILNTIKLKNLTVEEALEAITEEAIKNEYINSDKENAVIISYTSERQEIAQSKKSQLENPKIEANDKQKNLENVVKEVISRNSQAAIVEVVNASPIIREEANELGLSTGKYTIILEAWDEGLEVSPEKMKMSNIVNTIKEAGGNPGEIISSIQQKEHDGYKMEELVVKYQEKINQHKAKQKMHKEDSINSKQELPDNYNMLENVELNNLPDNISDEEVNHGEQDIEREKDYTIEEDNYKKDKEKEAKAKEAKAKEAKAKEAKAKEVNEDNDNIDEEKEKNENSHQKKSLDKDTEIDEEMIGNENKTTEEINIKDGNLKEEANDEKDEQENEADKKEQGDSQPEVQEDLEEEIDKGQETEKTNQDKNKNKEDNKNYKGNSKSNKQNASNSNLPEHLKLMIIEILKSKNTN